jgi:hypothetical protein
MVIAAVPRNGMYGQKAVIGEGDSTTGRPKCLALRKKITSSPVEKIATSLVN